MSPRITSLDVTPQSPSGRYLLDWELSCTGVYKYIIEWGADETGPWEYADEVLDEKSLLVNISDSPLSHSNKIWFRVLVREPDQDSGYLARAIVQILNPYWDEILNKPTTFPPSAHTHPVATQTEAGFMSGPDKEKLDQLAEAQGVAPEDGKIYGRKDGAWVDTRLFISPGGRKWRISITDEGLIQRTEEF